ncbi:hypothetical protein C8J56DRAFT_897063 [Mycena floridula]|nr:hypothetical protein C8J56DRAFT_897063 [Mycena floridula]
MRRIGLSATRKNADCYLRSFHSLMGLSLSRTIWTGSSSVRHYCFIGYIDPATLADARGRYPVVVRFSISSLPDDCGPSIMSGQESLEHEVKWESDELAKEFIRERKTVLELLEPNLVIVNFVESESCAKALQFLDYFILEMISWCMNTSNVLFKFDIRNWLANGTRLRR